MNSRLMANEALRILKAYREEYPTSSYVTVQYIGENFRDKYTGVAAPLKASSYQSLRSVMERLYHAKAVERFVVAAGKYKYRLVIDKWDERDPFKLQEGGTLPPSSPKPVDVAPSIIDAYKAKIKTLEDCVTTTVKRVKELQDELDGKEANVKVLHVKRYDGKEYKLKNRTFPKYFDRMRQLAECRRNIMLVGPAGCGKTFVAKLLSDVLDLPFASISCTAGMSEAHLLGRAIPDLAHGKSRFQGTDFLKVYEEGGIGLLDELDAADSNLMLCINSGLANGYMNVPNRPENPKALRHSDFICVATANTIGRGATRMYSGRNQLDEATLDRFRIGFIECGYDANIEKVVCPSDVGKEYTAPIGMNGFADRTVEKLVQLGYNLRGTCQFIRHKIEQGAMRRIMSTRFMEDAWIMMSEANWDIKQILEVFFEGWTSEEKAKVI